MSMQSIGRIRARLARDRGLPLRQRALKVVRYVSARLAAPFYLASCDRVGRGARTQGRPVIDNAGAIDIGDRVTIASRYAPVRFSTARSGRIEIGRDVIVNFGTSIAAASRVSVGNGVSFGPYVAVSDSDAAGKTAPVVIGDQVW